MRILLLERDGAVSEGLTRALQGHGHCLSHRLAGANTLITRDDADLVVLEVELAFLDHLSVLGTLRRVRDVPVLLVATLREGQTLESSVRVLPSEAGIPAELSKLLSAAASDTVEVQDMAVNLRARTVRVADKMISLTAREFDIVALLARHAGTAVSRQQIMREIWGEGEVAGQRLNVYISEIRNKLDRPHLLHTIRGYGYLLGGL